MGTSDARLQLLGGFRLVSDGSLVVVPERAAKLLALLAIYEWPLSRSRIAGEFWPEFSEGRASANLRSTVWRLPSSTRQFLSTSGSTMSIAEFVDVDVHEARDVVRQLLHGEGPRDASSAEVDLLSRPLLPEWDDDWLTYERERTRQLHIHALESLGHTLLASGDALGAVDLSICVVGMEPLRESAHVLLMSAYLACGNRADARRSLDRYCELMRDELGLDPAIDWDELVASPTARPPALSGTG
jgi:DNA-binding SARP family transcriptional activator